MNADREKQVTKPSINSKGNFSPSDATSTSLLDPTHTSAAHSRIPKFTNLPQNPTLSHALPVASKIDTKIIENSNVCEGDPKDSDKKPRV